MVELNHLEHENGGVWCSQQVNSILKWWKFIGIAGMLIMAVGSGLIHEGIDKNRDFLSSESVLLNGLVQRNRARNFMLCSIRYLQFKHCWKLLGFWQNGPNWYQANDTQIQFNKQINIKLATQKLCVIIYLLNFLLNTVPFDVQEDFSSIP